MIYRHACHPNQPTNPDICGGEAVGWEERPVSGGFAQLGFRNGALRYYGNDPFNPRYVQVVDVGLRFGVDTNLNP